MSETQPTLKDLLKQSQFATIKALSIAYGCSASKMGMILQGRYHTTLTKDEVVKLAALFEVSFDTCIAACDASYAEWKAKNGWAGSEYSKNYDNLKKRWTWEEELLKGAEQAKQTGDWSSFRSGFSFHFEGTCNNSESTQNNASGSTRWYESTTPISSCYDLLGVPSNATEAQIKKAFRQKAHEAHSNGDFTGDMDKLRKAKEQALANLTAKVQRKDKTMFNSWGDVYESDESQRRLKVGDQAKVKPSVPSYAGRIGTITEIDEATGSVIVKFKDDATMSYDIDILMKP